MASGVKIALRPQRDLLVAGLTGESDTFVDQFCANAKSPGAGLDIQKPQLCDGLGLLDQEDRTDDLVIAFGDPALLPFRVEVSGELSYDFGYERFEAYIPAILLRVEGAVTVNDPSEVSGARGA